MRLQQFLRLLALSPLMLLVGACASNRAGPAPTAGIFSARVMYVIHGDGDYMYHDAKGRRHRADEDVLKQAKAVGRISYDTEVLIFHQKTGWGPGMFGMAEGRFYHYRYGSLQRQKKYFRGTGDFNSEAELVRRHAAPSALVAEGVSKANAERVRRIPTVLAYFGHEIPQVLTDDDDSTALVVTRFAAGLRNLASPFSLQDQDGGPARYGAGQAGTARVKPFGLVILSTCYGGTPRMMTALAPLADYAVASPAHLHLSHLDTRALGEVARTDSLTGTTPWKHLATTVATQSFDRLKEKTQTEITVAVYDLEAVTPFARTFAKAYAGKYASIDASTARSSALRDSAGTRLIAWRDCAADPAFNGRQAAQGVDLLYRAPRFGPGKNTTARSGWQCPY